MPHTISDKHLTIADINHILNNGDQIELGESAIKKITDCRRYMDEKFNETDEHIAYGVNTGFGSLCNEIISREQLEQLQYNLLVSHACGTGDVIPERIVRIMLLLKVQSLAYGHSGASLELVQRLVDMYNAGVHPVVYEYGSLGASGDLAPLAHLALPLVGEGEVIFKGKMRESGSVLEELGWKPLKLKSKEGLALINGTQFMAAFGVHLLIESKKLFYWSHVTASIAMDGFNCNPSPFSANIHQIRKQQGQTVSAGLIRKMLDGSEIAVSEQKNVQDPYSFRCIPQVHGATYDTLAHVEEVITREINSVTDNPNVFPEEDEIISGGNFHGQPLALVLDYLAIAMAELGNIAERRIFQLMTGLRDLPAFLTEKPGINSGMMILQYAAASLVSANKQLATPASTDSIVSSNGQEDHVSMGANAATQAFKLVNNLWDIFAIEYIVAAQALDIRKPLKSSAFCEKMVDYLREEVKHLKEDRVLSLDISLSRKRMQAYHIDDADLFSL